MKYLIYLIFAFGWLTPLRFAHSYERKELIEGRLNPELHYFTIETSHFEIHFPEHLAGPAKKLSEVCEGVYIKVSGFFGWDLADKTHIVVSDRSDQVSLFTLGFPHKQIFFDVSLPPLSLGLTEYADWYEWLLTHEFGHVYQMERKAGAYKFLENIVGATAQPNMTVPPWFKEGLSTYLETKLTKRGRGDGPFYRMFIRQAVLNDDFKDENFVSLDTINNHLSPTWPWTLRAYLFGYYMVNKMEAKEPRSVNLVEEVASAIPYTFESNFKKVNLMSLGDFWAELKNDLKIKFTKEIEFLKLKKLTSLKYLTNSGFYKNGLTLAPNGKWLLSTQVVPEKETRIIRLNLGRDKSSEKGQSTLLDEEFILDRSTGSQISFSKSNRFIAFDESAKAKKYYVFTDIAIYDLKEKHYSSVSPNIRARDPDIHPDGKHMVFVLNDKGKNRLFTTDTAWKSPVDISGDVGFSRISTPRFSQNGSQIIMSIHNEDTGGEDLVLYADAKLTPLVANGSLNFSPNWVPGKNQIVFSSDLGEGVFNIYLYDLDSRKATQITNVIGGLFYPVVAPDLSTLYTVSYHSGGYDIAETPFDLSTARAVETSKLVTSQNFSYLRSSNIESESANTSEAKLKAEVIMKLNGTAYSGFSHLRPQYITPSMMFLPDTYQIGATIGAVDPLFLHHYELTLREDAATKNPVGRLYYFNGANDTSWDFDLNKQSYPDRASGLIFQKLNAEIGMMIPIKSFFRNLFVRPHFNYSKIDFDIETKNYGPGLALIDDTEFTQWGLSFPESGSYLELNTTRYLAGTSSDKEFTNVFLKYRRHFQIAGRNIYHLSFDAGTYLAPQLDANNGLLIGSKLSFPYSWGTELNLFGYPPNQFLATNAQILSQRLTFSFSQVERFFAPWMPLYLQRISGGILGQIARADTASGMLYPWSTGVEIYQDFTLGQLFFMKGSLGVYQGDTSLGGQTQVILSFEHTM